MRIRQHRALSRYLTGDTHDRSRLGSMGLAGFHLDSGMGDGIMTDIAKLLREAAYHLRGTDCPLSLPEALDVAAAELESAKVELRRFDKLSYANLLLLVDRLADLEAQLAAERERVSRYEEGYEGSCYACEPVALRNISLEAELAECEIENNFLRADLSKLEAKYSGLGNE